MVACLWSFVRSVLTRSEDVKRVFRDSDAHHKATNNNGGWLVGELLGKCLGLVNGDEWRQIRLCMGDSFTQPRVAAQIPRVVGLVEEYFQELRKTARLQRRSINPGGDLRLLPFRIVADYIYGPLTPTLRPQLEAMIPLRDSLFSRVIQGGVTRFSWSRFLPTTTNRDLKEFKKKWKRFNYCAYTLCKQQERKDLIDQLYGAYTRNLMTEDHLLQTLDEMLFGNLDVTIGSLSWNPMFLAANQDIQDELRRELRGASESRSQYLLRTDTLLAASISEAARLKPIAAFSIPQAAPTPRATGGYLVPEGTNFVIDTHALNIQDLFWGPDRTEDRPSRFLGRKAPADMRYRYWRYGFGPRQCLGKYLADAMMRIIMAHMVETYRLRQDAESSWDRNPITWITQANCDIRCEAIGQDESGGEQNPAI